MATTKLNPRAAGKKREIQVLQEIASYRWLTTAMLAKLVWTDSSHHVGVNKAQMVSKRLAERGYILGREGVMGIKCWVLTDLGADLVNADIEARGYEKGWAHNGYDVGFLNYQKQVDTVNLVSEKLRSREFDGAFGRGGIAGGLGEKFEGLDAVLIKKVGDGEYTTTGVLAIQNTLESTENKARALSKKFKLIFVGDERRVRTLKRRLGLTG